VPYFDQVNRFCFFLAPGTSGHSIIGHLLTAHPKILISDELAALSYFKEDYSAEQVYALIKYQDYKHQCGKRRKSGYSYWVNGAWQNIQDKHPFVIGDAKGGRSVKLLCEDNTFSNYLRMKTDVPLRAIIHVRNPMDIIATRIRKHGHTLEYCVNRFIRFEKRITEACQTLRDDEKLFQRHEDVIEHPVENFEKMFNFLDVEIIPEVVDVCANKIWEKPNKTRKNIKWTTDEINKLYDCISGSDLFNSYADDIILFKNSSKRFWPF